MKIIVIGGTGLIGSKLVKKLNDNCHTAIAASPSTGINIITGQGLNEAMKGADVVVDVGNSPSFEDKAVLEFFETAGKNIIAAERAAKVPYHIALSVVGTDLMSDSGYFRAKQAQEKLIKSSNIPYTIVRATQFMEFLGSIAQSGVEGEKVNLPKISFQPIAAEDVADILFQVVSEKPVKGIIEIAGPEKQPLSDMLEQYLKANNDPREVVTNENASYFGAKLAQDTLVPQGKARLGKISFNSWFEGQKKNN